MNRIKSGLLGFAAGLLNGLFGAGGGMAAVPMGFHDFAKAISPEYLCL